jgi:hypothetical protein
VRRLIYILIAIASLETGVAHGYETDQLTDRDQPPTDGLEAANAHMDEIMSAAIAATNQRTECALNRTQTRVILAREIHRRTAAPTLVLGRGLLRSLGYGRYSAWLKTGPVPRRYFPDRQDIYGALSFLTSPILSLVGPCSTIRINGVLMGTDKLHHFFAEGYKYFRRSTWGRDPIAALSWGTRMERTLYGLISSNAFSYADLRSNYDGFRFYRGLLEPGSVAGLDTDGCVEQVRPWSWAEWVNWEYDEVLNPSIYTRRVQAGIDRRLDSEQASICDSYRRWGGPAYVRQLKATLSSTPDYVAGETPPRSDPFDLEVRCSATASAPPQPPDLPPSGEDTAGED